MNGHYFRVGVLVADALRADHSPAVKVYETDGLAGVVDKSDTAPAFHVMYAGDSFTGAPQAAVADQRGQDRATYQGWDVACVVRQLDDPGGGQRLLGAAGELIDKAVGTLKGKVFPGYRAMRFKGVSPAPGHVQPRTGTGIYIASFEVTLPIT